MSIKFNLGDKKGKVNDIKADELDEEEITEDDVESEEAEEDEDDSKNKKSNSTDDFKKFIIKLVVIIVGGIVLLFIVLSIASLFTKNNVSYEKLEQIMVNAAESYFKDYPESLPKIKL